MNGFTHLVKIHIKVKVLWFVFGSMKNQTHVKSRLNKTC